MDIQKLQNLKTLADNLSILIIEDSRLLQNQLYTFLQKFFKNTYQAFDGEEGLELYEKFHPNIILTDLSMPKKNGLEMIKDIKAINNDVKVIILSAHNEEEILMNMITLNIKYFLLKPLNIDNFIDILLEILQLNIDTEENCLKDLEIIHEQKGSVQLINHFKDMIIEQEGKIININDDIVSIKIPHTQILAISYEQHTIIELKSIKRFIRCELIDIDKENDLIHLSKPIYTEFYLKKDTHKQYFYNRKFSLGLHDNHKYFELDVLDITSDTVTLFIEEKDTSITVYDNVNLTISLNMDKNKDKNSNDIYARGNVISSEPYREGISIIIHIEIEKKDLTFFHEYLIKIEDEIIKELVN